MYLMLVSRDFKGRVAQAANDPKLSDGGAWRSSCDGGAQREATDVGQSHDRTRRVRARIAATVTRGAVRCSAWLGVRSIGIKKFLLEVKYRPEMADTKDVGNLAA